MVKKIDKNAQRLKRHTRVRGKISGTPERPRLDVYRSNANIYAQIIDDVNGVTLAPHPLWTRLLKVPRATAKPHPRLVSCWPNVQLQRASRRLFSTAAAMSTMAVSQLLPTVRVKADSNFKAGGRKDGLQ